MQEILTRKIVKVGNSAGVILPRRFLNGEAEIKLINKPIEPLKDILEIIREILPETRGIYLTGSYARGEQTKKSDIDVLIITEKSSFRKVSSKYNIIAITEDALKKTLEKNALPLLPMIRESNSLLNSSLIKKYKKTKLNNKNTFPTMEIIKSSLKIVKESISLSKIENENISDNIIYSLIISLRTGIIINSLTKNSILTTKKLISTIKNISGSKEPYQAYLRSKNSEKTEKVVSVSQASKLIDYIEKEISKIEKWIKKEN